MKKLNLSWMLIALMGIFASCSEEYSSNAETDAEGVTFTVSTDFGAQTRVAPTIPPGRKLRYVMEVYTKANLNYIKSGSQTIKYVSTPGEQVSFVVPKQTQPYKCVFWADFYDDTDVANNAFDTDNLNDVKMLQDKPVEAYESFYAVTQEIAADANTAAPVTLKHAVAKVNVLTTNQVKDCKYAKITYGDGTGNNAAATGFNALSEEVLTNETTTIGATIDTDQTATASAPYCFHTFYFFAPKDKQQLVTVTGTLHESAEATDIIRSFKVTNVPLQSNYVTNMKGYFGVEAGVTMTVSCDADWNSTPNEPYMWDGTLPAVNAAYTFSGGDGKEATPYEIANVGDLAQMAANLSGGKNMDNYFKLTRDIDLMDMPWPTEVYAPKGFDGGGHTIRGLNLEAVASSDGVGFFYGADGAMIKNLHIEGKVIGMDNLTGGILGWDETNSSTISGCSFKGTVSSSTNVGGIAGTCGTIIGCKFMGELIYTGNGNSNMVGGIVGYCHNGATACYNTGTITITKRFTNNETHIGGITANDDSNNNRACYNIGTIELNGSVVSTDDINGGSGTGYTGKPAYIITAGSNLYFSETTWPKTTDEYWKAAADADGTKEKGYWKSLGSWNDGSPEYPKLWWE